MLQALVVTLTFDRRAVVAIEALGIAQPTRQQEMEQRPQLAQVVFQRRAAQAQALAGFELARGLGSLAARAFDVLGLVEDQHMQHQAFEVFQVLGQQRVGGQQQVVVLQFVEVFAPAQAMQGQDAQAGGEALRFVLPIGDQAGGHHHHGRMVQTSGVFLGKQVCQGLQGLAQAHVVGEDAAYFQLAQGLHPAQAFDLIGTQRGVEALRDLCRLLADITQTFAQVAHLFAALPVQGNVFQRIEAGGIQRRQAHAGFARLAQVEVAQRCQYRLESAVGQCYLQVTAYLALGGRDLHQQALVVAALVQLGGIEQFGVGAQYIEQNGQQAQALAVDLDTHFQVEPVASASLVNLRVPVVDLGKIEGEIIGVFDLPALLAQSRQVVEHKA
ncbi:hypothetical protein D3C77_373530 [compost metagenome]